MDALMWRAWALVLLACAAGLKAQPLDREAAFAASQAVLGRAAPEITLLDREGRPLTLARFRGRPLLVSFVYTGCFQACPIGTRALHDAVEKINLALGPEQYSVVSIGFNQPADSPQAMKAFAAQHRVGNRNWDFLSAPADQVEPLTRAFGFSHRSTPAGIDHIAQVTLVDANGRIVHQIYGERPTAEDVAEPVRRLLRAEPLPPRAPWSDLVDRLRLLCTVYDPETGTYRVSYALALEVAGGLTFAFAMAWFFLAEWRGRRRAGRR
ncbi:MAG: SCO family protein [Pseudomonadota bacterium]